MMNFADSVLPAPLTIDQRLVLRSLHRTTHLSPDTMIVWPVPSRIMAVYASSAMANKCGSSSPLRRPLYA